MRISRRMLSISLFPLFFWVALYAGSGKEAKVCRLSIAECTTNIMGYYSTYGWLGIEAAKDNRSRYVITDVFPESPAEEAGLAVWDRIVAYNGVNIVDDESFEVAESQRIIGGDLLVTIQRDGVKHEIVAKVVEIPESVLEAKINKHLREKHQVLSNE